MTTALYIVGGKLSTDRC